MSKVFSALVLSSAFLLPGVALAQATPPPSCEAQANALFGPAFTALQQASGVLGNVGNLGPATNELVQARNAIQAILCQLPPVPPPTSF